MKGMLNYLFIIILIGFISSCSTKRDKPIQEGNLETIRFDENQVRELPFSFFVDTIELIPLETTEENLKGKLREPFLMGVNIIFVPPMACRMRNYLCSIKPVNFSNR